jgi:hypothetical protein
VATNDSYNDRQVKVGGVVIKVMSRLTTRLYRLTDGRIGGKFLKGTDVVLVTTIGRRSGEPRTVPLLFMEDGADLILVASQGGMPKQSGVVLQRDRTPGGHRQPAWRRDRHGRPRGRRR